MKNTIPTNPIKKIGKTIITLSVLVGLFFGVNTYQKIMDNKNYVEPYCAAKYSHNVDDYKACKVLTPTQVLMNLKEQSTVVSEVINLPAINM